MFVVALVPFGEVVSSKDQIVELIVPLSQVLEAIRHWLLHDVEKNVVRIGILESFTDEK